MPNCIIVKINVDRIDKTKIFQGEKGRYLDVLLIPSDKYNDQDYMVVQGISKEDRDNGMKGNILGNAKNLNGSRPSAAQRKPAASDDSDSDIPF